MFKTNKNSCDKMDSRQISGSYSKGWKTALSTYEEIQKRKKQNKSAEYQSC
jgi:hypothetical protein